VKELQRALKIMCLVAFGANIVVMAFAWMVPSVELFMLGACSSVLVLFGYLYGDVRPLFGDKEDE